MSASTIIYGLLSTNTGVTNLVGTKIYPIEAPQTTAFPYIVFQAISNMPTNTKSGASSMDKTRIQVTAVGKKQSEIDAIGSAVRTALDFIKTPAPIQIITYEGEVDMYSYTSGQDGVFEKAQDYFLTTSR